MQKREHHHTCAPWTVKWAFALDIFRQFIDWFHLDLVPLEPRMWNWYSRYDNYIHVHFSVETFPRINLCDSTHLPSVLFILWCVCFRYKSASRKHQRMRESNNDPANTNNNISTDRQHSRHQTHDNPYMSADAAYHHYCYSGGDVQPPLMVYPPQPPRSNDAPFVGNAHVSMDVTNRMRGIIRPPPLPQPVTSYYYADNPYQDSTYYRQQSELHDTRVPAVFGVTPLTGAVHDPISVFGMFYPLCHYQLLVVTPPFWQRLDSCGRLPTVFCWLSSCCGGWLLSK